MSSTDRIERASCFIPDTFGSLESAFVGEDSELFAALHRRSSDQHRGGWVICSPFGSERKHAHRILFEWASAVADSGFNCLRFDYRGTGDSAGEFANVTIEDHVDDTLRAVEALENCTGEPCIGLIGMRLGATIAARAASRLGRPMSLVMWEPVVDGEAHCGELLRAAMANEIILTSGAPRNRATLRAEIEGGGTVLVDGFPLNKNNYEAIARIGKLSLDASGVSSSLLVQIDMLEGRKLRAQFQTFTDSHTEVDVDFERALSPPAWLRVKTWGWSPKGLFDTTLGWMHAHAPSASTTGPNEAATSNRRKLGNDSRLNGQAVRFLEFTSDAVRIPGILHEPANNTAERPRILLLGSGDASRSANFYVSLSRALCHAGWHVFRADTRGVGDSSGRFDCSTVAEVYALVERGVLARDTVASMDFLDEQLGPSKYILTGLCGGAVTASCVAAEDDRVVGMVPIDPLVFFVPVPDGSHTRTELDYLERVQILSQSRFSYSILTFRRFTRRLRSFASRVFGRSASAELRKNNYEIGSQKWCEHTVGPNTNTVLVHSILRASRNGIPAYFLLADTPHYAEFQKVVPGLLKHAASCGTMLEERVVKGSDHVFMTKGSTDLLTSLVVSWLARENQPWIDALSTAPVVSGHAKRITREQFSSPPSVPPLKD